MMGLTLRVVLSVTADVTSPTQCHGFTQFPASVSSCQNDRQRAGQGAARLAPTSGQKRSECPLTSPSSNLHLLQHPASAKIQTPPASSNLLQSLLGTNLYPPPCSSLLHLLPPTSSSGLPPQPSSNFLSATFSTLLPPSNLRPPQPSDILQPLTTSSSLQPLSSTLLQLPSSQPPPNSNIQPVTTSIIQPLFSNLLSPSSSHTFSCFLHPSTSNIQPPPSPLFQQPPPTSALPQPPPASHLMLGPGLPPAHLVVVVRSFLLPRLLVCVWFSKATSCWEDQRAAWMAQVRQLRVQL